MPRAATLRAVALLIGAIVLAPVAWGQPARETIAGWSELQPPQPKKGSVFVVQGWAVSATGDVRLRLLVDGREFRAGKPFLPWPGVAERYPQMPDADHAGFSATIDPSAFPIGEHTVAVEVSSGDGREILMLPESRFVTIPPLSAFVAAPALLLLFVVLPIAAGWYIVRRRASREASPGGDGWKVYVAVAVYCVALAAAVVSSARFGMSIPSERSGMFGPLANWDGNNYQLIAERGYGAHAESLYAFFPLYPAALSVLRFLPIPVELAGSTLAVLLFLLSLRTMRRLGADDTTLLLFAGIPFSVFFVANYTESLALFLSVAVAWSASRDRTQHAFAAGVLAGMTRITCLALVFFAIDSLRERKWLKALALASGPPIGLACYSGYLWVTTGDPLKFLHIQQQFGRGATLSPGYILEGLIQTTGQRGMTGAWEVAFATVVLVGGAVLCFKGNWGAGLYSAALIYLPLATGRMTSINRYALLAFPVYLLLFSSIRSKRMAWFVLGVEALLALYFAAKFGRQDWVG